MTRLRRSASATGKRPPSEAEGQKAAAWDPGTERARRHPWARERPTPALVTLDQQLSPVSVTVDHEIRIERPTSGGGDGDRDGTVVQDVRAGLTAQLKELPSKLLYDARGSKLFDRITALREYYPSRAERAILNRRAPEIVAESGSRELVELGSGTASKTRALLYAMAGAGTLRRYVPFDVDASVVERCAGELVGLYPGLAVHGVVGDFERDLAHVPEGDQRLFAFLGSTIGNLYPAQRAAFFGRLRLLMKPTDRLLVGTDLVKDREVLEAAYNDSQGVTAEFNRNVLHAVNDRLGADFVPEAFEHVAFFDEANLWIEMRLRSRRAQTVRIAGAELEVTFDEGEELRTEISAKFTADGVETELAGAGLRLDHFHTDENTLFGLALARPNGDEHMLTAQD